MYYLSLSFRIVCVCEGTAQNEAVFRPRSWAVHCRLHHDFLRCLGKSAKIFTNEWPTLSIHFWVLFSEAPTTHSGCRNPWGQECFSILLLQPLHLAFLLLRINISILFSESVETSGLKDSRRAAYPGILSPNNSWGGCLRTKYLREREKTIIKKNSSCAF